MFKTVFCNKKFFKFVKKIQIFGRKYLKTIWPHHFLSNILYQSNRNWSTQTCKEKKKKCEVVPSKKHFNRALLRVKKNGNNEPSEVQPHGNNAKIPSQRKERYSEGRGEGGQIRPNEGQFAKNNRNFRLPILNHLKQIK